MFKLTIFFLTMVNMHKVFSDSDLFNEELYKSALNTTLCERHITEMNTLAFFDASFRIPQSITLGGQGSLGNYEQCLKIRQELSDDVIEGKYCMTQIMLDEIPFVNLTNQRQHESFRNSEGFLKRVAAFIGARKERHSRAPGSSDLLSRASFRLAVCIPKTCTVQQAVGRYLEPLNVTLRENYCRLPNDKVYSTVDWVAIAIFSLIGLLTLLSTSYDLYNTFLSNKDPKQINTILKCCSVYTNTRRLFTFSNVPGAIECLDGIRSISILWVVMGHSLTNTLIGMIINPLDALKWANSWNAIWLTSGNLSVDTFFMMSGLLIVYTTANKLSQSSLVKNIHLFYLHRLLRMFPLLAAVILLQASILHHVADGPNWNNIVSSIRSCRQWWWLTLLHVQNYVKMSEICLPHSWYLAVDTQLHVISPLVLYWVLGGRRSATVGLTSGLLISLFIAITYCYTYDFSGLSFQGMAQNMGNNFKLYYVNTLTRSPPFFVGMMFGYLLHVNRGRKVHLPALCISAIWTAAAVLGSSMIYITYPGLVIQRFWLNLLNAIMRPLWALFLGCVVFACDHGYGGPVNWFLSLKVWKFFSRVSYSLYLCHYPLQFILRAAESAPSHFSISNMINTYISDVVLSLFFAVILCILVDAPCSTLLKVILESKKKKPVKGDSREELTA